MTGCVEKSDLLKALCTYYGIVYENMAATKPEASNTGYRYENQVTLWTNYGPILTLQNTAATVRKAKRKTIFRVT